MSNDTTEFQGNVLDKIPDMVAVYLEKWEHLPCKRPDGIRKFSFWDKIKYEKILNRLIDDMISLIKRYKRDSAEWPSDFKSTLDAALEQLPLISYEELALLKQPSFMKATKSFFNQAQAFDSTLGLEEIGQAMRNLWIINIIQKIGGVSVQLTPSAMGYSLLYPYTDNFLDSNDVPKSEKDAVMKNFSKRLAGVDATAASAYDKTLFELVGMIESEYSRATFPQVYESLLAIQHGQMKSMAQQDETDMPQEKDILKISIEKGGSSVLADAYLALGHLEMSEMIFYFGYGVILQLSDDLQDLNEDQAQGHRTIFTQWESRQQMDHLVNKLMFLTDELLAMKHIFKCDEKDALRELIQHNMYNLILFSAVEHKKRFSRYYYRFLKQTVPFRPSYLKGLNKKIKRQINELDERYDDTKLEDILTQGMNAFISDT